MLLNCGVGEDSWVPSTARRSNQSILEEISPEYSLEAETPILGPLLVKNWLIGKDPDAGKGWKQEEKGMTEDEMVGGHHQLNGHEFEQAPGVGDGQGSLACYSPWGCKDSDATEQLNWTELMVSGPTVWVVCVPRGWEWGWDEAVFVWRVLTLGSWGVLWRGGWDLGAPTQCLFLPPVPEPPVQKQHLDPRWDWCSKTPPVNAQWPLEG